MTDFNTVDPGMSRAYNNPYAEIEKARAERDQKRRLRAAAVQSNLVCLSNIMRYLQENKQLYNSVTYLKQVAENDKVPIEVLATYNSRIVHIIEDMQKAIIAEIRIHGDASVKKQLEDLNGRSK